MFSVNGIDEAAKDKYDLAWFPLATRKSILVSRFPASEGSWIISVIGLMVTIESRSSSGS